MHTLVLNAGYEPLAVVSFKRALMLVLNNKATILAGSSESIVHSANQEFELPTVILLARYVRVASNRAIPVSRRGVLRRDGHTCAYCGRYANTIDHVQPKSRGGRDSWENLVAACLKCNNKKGDRTLTEIGWTLAFTPKTPTGINWVVRGAEKVDPEWSNYLALASAA